MRMTVLVAAACVLLCNGCASIVTGHDQSLSVVTSSDGNDVEGAKCALSNDKGSWFVTSPGSVTVRRSINDLMVSCTLDGHEKAEQPVKSTTKGMVAGNVLIGGVMGVGVDVASGAAFDDPNVIAIVMSRIGSGPGAATTGSAPAPAASSAEATTIVAVAMPSVAVATPADVPVALRPGVRLTFLDRDAISKVPVGETTSALVETTSKQRIYNELEVTCRHSGYAVRRELVRVSGSG